MPARLAPTFGSLFSGIGGIDLGLERAGWRCAWQVEIDGYARRVLAKHWPDVPRFRDVREVGTAELARVDLIAGGFPCQDVSVAGSRAGLAGQRSGLWREYRRIVAELAPSLVLIENVPGLVTNGLRDVLWDLAALGYACEWDIVPAAALGAPHLRERLFVVAYADGERLRVEPERDQRGEAERGIAESLDDGPHGTMADADRGRLEGGGPAHDDHRRDAPGDDAYGRGAPLAHPHGRLLAVGSCFGRTAREELAAARRSCSEGAGVWAAEPGVGRVADGVPRRVDRLRTLGNAVVPQVAEWLGRRLLAAIQPPAEQGDHGVGPCGGRP
jgi:DNA (cytosine-5)-methyltransferase 1